MKRPPASVSLSSPLALSAALLSFFILHSSFVIQAAEPPSAPILRIEAGMHTAMMQNIATDKDGRMALTCSDDKTAKLWALGPAGASTARLVRTLRPPAGHGTEGRLYACSLSKDGRLAAAGGWTGPEWDRVHYLYVFDTSTGELLQSLHLGFARVLSVEFSESGSLIAIGLGAATSRQFIRGQGGVRVFSTRNEGTWSEVGKDTSYAERCYGLDWKGDQTLATTAYDGKLRLYSIPPGQTATELIPLAESAATLGAQPHAIAFSPDGSTVAVGFDDRPRVALHRAKDLSFLGEARTSDITGMNNAFRCVTWSADGKLLAAAGRTDRFYDVDMKEIGGLDAVLANMGNLPRKNGEIDRLNDMMIVRVWPVKSPGVLGTPRDLPMAVTTVLDVQPIGDTTFLYSAASPEWGTVSTTGNSSRTVLGAPPLIRFGSTSFESNFKVSQDGSRVSFLGDSLQQLGQLSFSVDRRMLAPAGKTGAGEGMSTPRGDATGVRLQGWGSRSPTLNGRPIALAPHENASSRAVAPDGSWFALGTEWTVKRIGVDGDIRWSFDSPSITKGLNVCRDGKLILAAYSDGTIRWHRADTGAELLALFPHADRLRWVLWTPSGYYDCAPGAEDLIGWHVNRGKTHAADFFPAPRFRAIYYRPDVIRHVLETLDVAEAVRLANAALGWPTEPPSKITKVIADLSPPVVELASGGILREVILADGQQELELGYRVRQTSLQPTTRIEIRANGRPVPVKAPPPRLSEEVSITVPLPTWFEGEIAVIASHALASSEAATLRVRHASPTTQPSNPKLFVISVGAAELAMNQSPLLAANTVSGKAKDRFVNLEFAAEDAKKVATLLATQQGKSFEQVETHVLLNEQATTVILRKAIQDIGTKAELGDVVFFFFSGHGNHDPKTGKFHLVTHDTDPKREAETALSGEQLSQLLGQVRGYVVVALDACHSGAVLGMQLGEKYKAPLLDISGLANQLSSAEHGIVVLSSSTPDQISFEDRETGGGLFTKALLEGLGGKAAAGGKVTCGSLMKWLDSRLPELSAEGTEPSQDSANPQQTPVNVMPKGVPDFVLARP